MYSTCFSLSYTCNTNSCVRVYLNPPTQLTQLPSFDKSSKRKLPTKKKSPQLRIRLA